MLDRRPTLPCRCSVSFRQPHQPNISNLQQFPQTIIVGRAFGPFLRSTSLQQSPPAGTSKFRRQKSIDGDMILVESRSHAGYQVGDGNKLQVVTSRQAETTRIDINPDGTTNTVAPSFSPPPAKQGETVTETEEINARNNRQYNSSNNNNCQTTTRAPKEPPAAAVTGQYKFLRRQYSMDQKQLGFQIGPSATSAAAVKISHSRRWARSHLYESVDVVSGRGCVGIASGEFVEVEEDRRKEQKHWKAAVGQEDQEGEEVILGGIIFCDDPSNSW